MDVESGMAEAMSFAETRVRNGFVRKVFGIVAIQLAITVGFACACIYVPEIRVSMQSCFAEEFAAPEQPTHPISSCKSKQTVGPRLCCALPTGLLVCCRSAPHHCVASSLDACLLLVVGAIHEQ